MTTEPQDREYFDFEEHKGYRLHYIEGRHGGLYLAFCRAFRAQAMPPDMVGSDHKRELLIDIWDTKVQRLFTGRHVVAYMGAGGEDLPCTEVQSDGYRTMEVHSLQHYFYSCHYCACHREQSIKAHNELPANWRGQAECAYGRYMIQSIVWEKRPHLILYSERMDEEELEARLRLVKGAK